jgi:hypothetical protein
MIRRHSLISVSSASPSRLMLMPFFCRSFTASCTITGIVRCSSCVTGPPCRATITISLTPAFATAWIAPATFVLYFGNHIEPATDLGFHHCTGPLIMTVERYSPHEHASERQHSGTSRFGSVSAGSAVLEPPQSYPNLTEPWVLHSPKSAFITLSFVPSS